MRKLAINVAWAMDTSNIDGRRHTWWEIVAWVMQRYPYVALAAVTA